MSTATTEFRDSGYLDTALPASKRIYIPGKIYPGVRVPLREISVSQNPSVRVYDTRGPWGDSNTLCDVRQGLPAVRQAWIVDRGDTIEIDGRSVRPEDDGYLSLRHAQLATQSELRTRL